MQRDVDQSGIFVICFVVGFEVDEVDFLRMRIVSILRKLQPISSVLINCVETIKVSNSICYVHMSICY